MPKKSFVLHLDSLDVLDELSDAECGQLLRAIRDYNNTKIVNLSGLLKAVFLPFKNQFDRDEEKYNAISLRNRQNGALGGRTQKNPEEPKETQSVILGTQRNPKKPDNDNDSDSDSDSDNTNTDASLVLLFEKFRKAYQGSKRGCETELAAFKKKYPKEWRQIVPLLLPSYEAQLQDAAKRKAQGMFVPEPAHLSTYLNQRRWEVEAQPLDFAEPQIPAVEIPKHPYVPAGATELEQRRWDKAMHKGVKNLDHIELDFIFDYMRRDRNQRAKISPDEYLIYRGSNKTQREVDAEFESSPYK